jgi:L-amino acid N-acyltransferase
VAEELIRLRLARPADLPRILSIYNREVLLSTATYDTRPRSPAEHARWFAHHGPRHPVFVAVEGRKVLGWASLSPWSDRPAYDRSVEVSVYVDESARGRGIGKRLLKELVDAAGRLGHHALLARISADNEVSVHLHRSLGFELAGTLKEVGFKFGRMLDVAVMELVFPG